MVEASVFLERVSKATGEVKEKIMAKGIMEYLKSSLREVNAKIIELCNKYGVTSAKEMEEKYKRGELEEEDTWRDFFMLSHLEERKEILEKLLEEISVE
jgi:ABC-type phosphate/phosphonate transport system ATPase subunit